MTDFKKLAKTLVENSIASNFKEAIEEWDLKHIQKADNWNNCLCGKDIKELCFIHNKKTDVEFIIGNECIKKICPGHPLLGKTNTIFDCLDRIRKDLTKAPNKALLLYAKNNNVLNDWEYKFTEDTRTKKKLTDKQINCRVKINKKLLELL